MRETVAELVSAMKKQDVLGSRGRRLVIQDRAELERCMARRDAHPSRIPAAARA